MNDPHVEALHYWVEHDGSVDYSKAQPFEYEFREFWVRLENRKVTVRPKGHYARECRHIHRHSRESGNPKTIGSKCVLASYRILGSRFRGNDGNRR